LENFIRDHFTDLGIGGKIKLKGTVEKQVIKV
jgi:hypothetical protein